MTNVDYRFTSTEEGSLVFRSTVNSFGLDSVTDKDISSFYNNFSNFAHFDTGLLPVTNTGLLTIRSAGNHMQMAFQYEPGMYRINWGKYEADASAKTYYVAQPYRIVIGDFLDGNFLGARMFYTVSPVTHPDVQLYHVNLPNINCRGYRGNGVGWICLYRNHDITSYPINEKLVYLLERCSGVEAYNDANMSETDGPRFYQSHYNFDEAYSRLWDPDQWQATSEQNGYEWTLDPDLWVPVKVAGIDDQGCHDQNGINFTFKDALLGNYSAYYDDKYLPKPINALTRDDLEFDSNTVFNWFKQSYNNSSTKLEKVDNLHHTAALRVTHVKNPTISAFSADDDDMETEPDWYCSNCENGFTENDECFYLEYEGESLCESCGSDKVVFCEHESTYLYSHKAVYCNTSDTYYPDMDYDNYNYYTCPHCSSVHVTSANTVSNAANVNIYTLNPLPQYEQDYTPVQCCNQCVLTVVQALDPSVYNQTAISNCHHCHSNIPMHNHIDLNVHDVDLVNDRNVILNAVYTLNETVGPDQKPYVAVCNYHRNQPPYLRNNFLFEPKYNLDNLATCICGKHIKLSEFVKLTQDKFPWNTVWINFDNTMIDLSGVSDSLINSYVENYADLCENNVVFHKLIIDKTCQECIDKDYFSLETQERIELFKQYLTSYKENYDPINPKVFGFSILPYATSPK